MAGKRVTASPAAENHQQADSASSIESVRERLLAKRYDLLLMDLNYARDTTSGREGLELLAEVLAHDPLLPVIVMTGWATIETAVRRCPEARVRSYTNRGTTPSSYASFGAKSTRGKCVDVLEPWRRANGRMRG